MEEIHIAYALIGVIALILLTGAVMVVRRQRAKAKANRGLGRIGRNYIDLRTPDQG